MLLLRCTEAVRTTDEGRPCLLVFAHVVRPEETGREGLFPQANWWELPEQYTISGPLGLTRHPGGGAPTLTVPDYSVSKVWQGPVIFILRVYDPNFDPSPFLGGVFAAAGRGGEGRRELYFRRWTSDPNNRTGPDSRLPEQARRLSLEELDLSSALLNRLESEGITTAVDLCVRTAEELMEIRNFGKDHLQEVRDKLAAAGLWLGGEGP